MPESATFKQALVVRLDLRMGRGKIAVQCSHAAVACAETARTKFSDWWRKWLEEGQSKIALKARDLRILLELKRQAGEQQLPAYLVRDRGLTQVPPGTITCLAIGPAPAVSVDGLTGNLPLL